MPVGEDGGLALLEHRRRRADGGLDLELVGVGHGAAGAVGLVREVQDAAVAQVHDHVARAVALAAQHPHRAVDERPAGEPGGADPDPLQRPLLVGAGHRGEGAQRLEQRHDLVAPPARAARAAATTPAIGVNARTQYDPGSSICPRSRAGTMNANGSRPFWDSHPMGGWRRRPSRRSRSSAPSGRRGRSRRAADGPHGRLLPVLRRLAERMTPPPCRIASRAPLRRGSIAGEPG